MTEHLRAPGFADEVIMFDDPAMTLKISAALQDEDEVFVGKADQLCQVTFTRVEMIFHELDSTCLFFFYCQI